MNFTFTRAERRRAKLRLGLVGPAGSGKTYTALLIAKGLGGRVALIDTENGSGELYASLAEYDVARLGAPYEPQRYVDAIHAAEAAGYSVIIIDSLSHAWAGEGGCLDIQGRIADSGKGNSYTAWRTVTPKHNALVEALLQSPSHIIATLRAKTEYATVQENGKAIPKKIGLAPIQRDGVEYEFTTVLDIDQNHNASATKDRTQIFDGKYFRPDVSVGAALLAWLDSGTTVPAPVAPAPRTVEQQRAAEDTAHRDEPIAQPPAPQAQPSDDYAKRLKGYVDAHGKNWASVSKAQAALGMGEERALKLPPEKLKTLVEYLEAQETGGVA